MKFGYVYPEQRFETLPEFQGELGKVLVTVHGGKQLSLKETIGRNSGDMTGISSGDTIPN